MIRITDAIREVISGNPILQFGLQHRLLNLSQTAAYLKPLIETRAKKQVSVNALTMALSRLQRSIKKKGLQRENYRFDRINMQTGLSTFTFTRTPETHAEVHKLYNAIQKKNGYITISQGSGQITVIIESRFKENVRNAISARARFRHENIAAIGIAFDEKYIEVPGLIYVVLQQMMLLNINIIEVSSTFTELVLYVAESDLKTAFEALEVLFRGENS